MMTCYACKQPYPSSFEWCEICKAPLLKPYQPYLFQCPHCNKPLASDTPECPACSMNFDIKKTPKLSQWPDWYSWNNAEVQKKARQLIGIHGSSDLSTKHLIGLAHSLLEEEKTQQAYAIASLASAKLSKESIESYDTKLVLGLAKLFIDFKRPTDAVAILSMRSMDLTDDLSQIANYYEFLGVSYLELGFYSVAQILLEKALEYFAEMSDHEALYKSASNLFMGYLASEDRRKATITLARMIKILDNEFMEPFRDDIVPVSFYLFNQLFWSSFQTNKVQRIDPDEEKLVKAMTKILEKIVKKGDLRFVHFIDFDRVVTATIVAGDWNEAEKIVNKLLNLARSSSDEQGALLLKWMGALHLAGQQEKEEEIWNQVQGLLPKIREKSIRNAIITFQLREIVEFYDAKYYNELRIFPEEYSRVHLSKPSILGRSRYLPFEPTETHLGVSIVFPKKAVMQLIKMLKRNSNGYHVFPYIVSLGKQQKKINVKEHSQKELEILAIMIKKEGKIRGFQFISLPRANSKQTPNEFVEREYELFGYIEKPDRAEGISSLLLSSLKDLQEEARGGTVYIYINQLRTPSIDAIFKQKAEKT